MIITDKKGRIRATNVVALKWLNRGEKQIEGSCILSVFPDLVKHLRVSSRQLYDRVKASRDGIVCITKILLKGRSASAFLKIEISRSAHEKILFFIIKKITMSEYIEQLYLEKLKFYEEVVGNLSEMVYKTDVNGNLLYFNKEMKRIFGYTSRELGQHNFLKFVHPEWRKRVKKHYKKQFQKGKENTYMEFPVITKKGAVYWIGQHVKLIRDGKWILGFYGVAVDISPLKKIEKQWIEERNRAQKYLEMSGVMFVELDSGERIRMLNRAACEMIGFSYKAGQGKYWNRENDNCKNLIGENWFRHFVPAAQREAERKRFRRLIEGKAGDSFYDSLMLNRKGEKRNVAWHNVLLKETTGKVTGVLFLGRDITRERQIESNLMNAVLKGEERERRRIAGDLHDGIQPLLSTVKFRLSSFNEKVKNASAEASAEYGSIVELLNTAQQEVRAISHNLTPPALRDFGLKTALRDLCEEIDRKDQLKVRFFFSGEEQKLSSSVENEIYRIAQEILNNAVHHSGASEVNVQMIFHKKSILLMIEDNGRGFNIKEKFSKGLGISNMSARVKTIGGWIDIDSRPEKGTTVSVEVPI